MTFDSLFKNKAARGALLSLSTLALLTACGGAKSDALKSTDGAPEDQIQSLADSSGTVIAPEDLTSGSYSVDAIHIHFIVKEGSGEVMGNIDTQLATPGQLTSTSEDHPDQSTITYEKPFSKSARIAEFNIPFVLPLKGDYSKLDGLNADWFDLKYNVSWNGYGASPTSPTRAWSAVTTRANSKNPNIFEIFDRANLKASKKGAIFSKKNVSAQAWAGGNWEVSGFVAKTSETGVKVRFIMKQSSNGGTFKYVITLDASRKAKTSSPATPAAPVNPASPSIPATPTVPASPRQQSTLAFPRDPNHTSIDPTVPADGIFDGKEAAADTILVLSRSAEYQQDRAEYLEEVKRGIDAGERKGILEKHREVAVKYLSLLEDFSKKYQTPYKIRRKSLQGQMEVIDASNEPAILNQESSTKKLKQMVTEQIAEFDRQLANS